MKSISAFPGLVLALLALGFSAPSTPAYTMNPLALHYADYDGGVEYDFVTCDSVLAEWRVTVAIPGGGPQEQRRLEWYFRRDTMTQARWDSMLAYQEIHSGDPAVYILPTGRLRTIRADGRVTDTVVHFADVQASEPMLFPRKNHRILLYSEFLPSVEFTGDTTFSFGEGKAARSLRVSRVRKAAMKPFAPSRRSAR